MISGDVAMFDIPDGFTERDAERMCNMISAVLIGVPTPTGAECAGTPNNEDAS
jgi:hypothetical protein